MQCTSTFNFKDVWCMLCRSEKLSWEYLYKWNWEHSMLLLLLLLTCFSCVWLCATPETAAHQALPSLGFSRQEYWSGLPCLLQWMKVKSESEVAQSCLTLSNPMDCSPPGSSVPGIFQTRVLEWGAIAFSGERSIVTIKTLQITWHLDLGTVTFMVFSLCVYWWLVLK